MKILATLPWLQKLEVMFGKRNESTISPSTSSSSTQRSNNSFSHNSIVSGTRIEGKVHSATDFRIDGEFSGHLLCDARVVIGPSGEFDGEIECQNAIIEGKFNGILKIVEVLEVKEGAAIEGDVSTNKLVVHQGSIFDVNCTMGQKPIPAGSENNGSILETVENEANGLD